MRRSKEVKVGLLTASLATFLAGCDQQGTPVPMTEQNRPAYQQLDRCQKDFGEQRCERHVTSSGGYVYRPMFVPGQTHIYEGSSGPRGYFQGSPTAIPRVSSPGISSGAHVSAPGGFGGHASSGG